MNIKRLNEMGFVSRMRHRRGSGAGQRPTPRCTRKGPAPAQWPTEKATETKRELKITHGDQSTTKTAAKGGKEDLQKKERMSGVHVAGSFNKHIINHGPMGNVRRGRVGSWDSGSARAALAAQQLR